MLGETKGNIHSYTKTHLYFLPCSFTELLAVSVKLKVLYFTRP